MITIKRIYDPVPTEGGYQVLVDRFWPRGISKEKAPWREWKREISPSRELCKWFSHDPAKWDEFKARYRKELSGREDELKYLRQLEDKHKNLTLLYAARDEEHNNAVVLREILSGTSR